MNRSEYWTKKDATWAVLDRAIVLFRQVALDAGKALSYTYPQQVDDQVSAYLEAIRETPSSQNNSQSV